MTSLHFVRFAPLALVALFAALGCGRVHLGTHDGGSDRDAGGYREPCGMVLCEVGQVCCNASCNLCVEPAMACPAIACPPGCRSDAECAPGEYCEPPDGTCSFEPDAPGRCAVLPDACPPVIMPVCGCDGVTYQSRCDAAARGYAVLFDGPCRSGGPCVESQDCGADAYCHYPMGACTGSGDGMGECRLVPGEVVACLLFGPPICGCDGHTYGCEAEANQSGASALHEGPCGPACAPMDATAVGDCFLDLGARWDGARCERIGGCRCEGADCGRLFETIEECTRANEGCERPPGGDCGGFFGSVCRPDEWCDFTDPHVCGGADEMGSCLPRPAICDGTFEPTCGCDGLPYGNPCEAHAAGWDDRPDPTGACGAP